MASVSLIPCPKAKAYVPGIRSDSAPRLWLVEHPDLGVKIAGRRYFFGPALDAIARGLSLPEAAKIGRACRKQRDDLAARSRGASLPEAAAIGQACRDQRAA